MAGADLSVADMAIALVIGVSMLFGVMRGLLKEVVSLAIWSVAVVLGLAFGEPLGAAIGLEDAAPRLSGGVGFAAVFVAVLVAGALVQRMLRALVDATGLSGTDRTLGLVFGVVRGGALVVLGLVTLRAYASQSAWWDDSVLAPHLLVWEEDVLAVADYLAELVGARSSDVASPLL